MKIGIGVTTTPNRKEHLEEFRKNVLQYTCSQAYSCPAGYRGVDFNHNAVYIFPYVDSDKKGIAFAKNKCLQALKDCDYIFLFDDDVWPKQTGWEKFFIDSGMDHLLYLNRSHQKQFEYALPNGQILESYKECGGVFMMITKKAFEKVGYLDSNYVGYGYEHAGYSQRIHLAGLNPSPFVQLKGTKDYLHSLDYDGYGDYSHLPQKSSISDAEKQKNLGDNWQIYLQERGNFFNFYKDFKG